MNIPITNLAWKPNLHMNEERENAPLLNNLMGNWKETSALPYRGFAFPYRGAHGWQVLSSAGDRVCFSAWEDISPSDLPGTKYRFCLEREKGLRFLYWVISSMQGSLYDKMQKSSQFYLISWNGKVFSRSLIKCSLTEGACLPRQTDSAFGIIKGKK